MADRLTDIVLGLQRMAENARLRIDDLEYSQREERHELVHYLDQLLSMVEKVRHSLLDDRKRLMPAERIEQRPQDQAMPRIVKQGPKEAAG